MKNKIKVLIVDDSPVKRKILAHILEQDSQIEIIGYAKNADETLEAIRKQKPDLITMDINIPGGINGFELTKFIMNKNPIPIIVISAIRNQQNKLDIMKALTKSGALFFIDSPPGPWNEKFDLAAKNIIKHVKLLSNPEVFKKAKFKFQIPNEIPEHKKIQKKIILIGISTGGPAILSEIISQLPADFKTPIVIAQHISYGFDKLLASQLRKSSKVNIRLADNHEPIEDGNIYLAPAAKITEIMHNELIVTEPPKNYTGHLPPVSALFASAVSYYGKNVIGIIMTGMGADGVDQLKMLKENGAVTIAQDKESSVVYGMPKEAVKRDAATYVMNPQMITDYLIKFDKQ